MKIGIEKINLYAGWLSTDAVELAVKRGKEREYATDEVMVGRRTVLPDYEDATTMAVNAARPILSEQDRKDIGLVIVATESGVDFSKPISTWVRHYCGISENSRNFEIKHACFSATGAVKMALAWVKAMGNKALVVSSDFTWPFIAGDTDFVDFIGGGCAVAMLISDDPQILEIDLEETGYWTYEIADSFRPLAGEEIIDGQDSVYSYLDALDGAFDHFESRVEMPSYDAYFKRHLYHTPFPGMSFLAHRNLLGRLDSGDKASIRSSFERKVLPGIRLVRRLGTVYGASTFVGLMSLLSGSEDLEPEDRISIFAYGSGCQSEIYTTRVGPSAHQRVRALQLDAYLDQRLDLSLEQYEENERMRKKSFGCADHKPHFDAFDHVYERFYDGRGLLVLKEVKDFRRRYELS